MRSILYLLAAVLAINAAALTKPFFAALKERPEQDEAVISEIRLRPLRQNLQPGSQTGYLADGEVTHNNLIRLDGCRRFYMTQYALAPAIVVHDSKASVVIGNFSSQQTAANAIETHDLTIINDLGQGLFLLKNIRHQ